MKPSPESKEESDGERRAMCTILSAQLTAALHLHSSSSVQNLHNIKFLILNTPSFKIPHFAIKYL